jgi:thiamine-monophosphate kinase
VTGEFAAIERLRQLLPGPGPESVGIGDDAAAIRVSSGGWLLLAIDTVVAGIHVDLTLTGLDDLGWKAFAVNVSDIAAMGGRPDYGLLSIAGPPGTDLDLLARGVADAARTYDCSVVGGDLANADTLVVTVAISGRADGDPVLRSGARPGDGIWVTGPLGLSAAGLRLLREKKDAVGRASAAHRRPQPSVAAGLAARASGATAMIDVSDGLVADLGHIADASHVGFALERLPVAEEATFEEALIGGEDYVLVFTASDRAAVLKAFAELPAPELIGACTDDPHERTFEGRLLPTIGGWEHTWTARGA